MNNILNAFSSWVTLGINKPVRKKKAYLHQTFRIPQNELQLVAVGCQSYLSNLLSPPTSKPNRKAQENFHFWQLITFITFKYSNTQTGYPNVISLYAELKFANEIIREVESRQLFVVSYCFNTTTLSSRISFALIYTAQ
ncbi:hypothetical protein T10_4362 [Trichinella papuae]|uniref:Uncharacterized protein n=1 Tax=Trichinella papuae TaxID=268474 RepID=A0A0V1M7Z7_9BILA|nr:hypothetical protein T10_4362 [Trichinella papuae]